MYPQGLRLAGERFVQECANVAAYVAVVALILGVPACVIYGAAYLASAAWHAGAN